MIEDIIEPGRMLLRNAAGEVVMDTARPHLAVLAHVFGTWTNEVHAAPVSALDSAHVADHDVGAAPPGATYIFGSIRLAAASYWHEFSGAVELGSITHWNGNDSYPRVMVVYHQLAPVFSGGRVKLRERWWVHGGPGVAQYAGWPNGVQIHARSWHYDLRICAFVGGV